MKDISISKKELRKEARALRESFSHEQIEDMSARACKILSSVKEFAKADTILIYYPIKNEISPLPIISIAKELGKRIAFPLCDKESRTLGFKEIDDISLLMPSDFGLYEPSPDSSDAIITQNTLCVVPALLFSREGHRLGYGMGYYDRFLEGFIGKSIGLTYSYLLRDAIPHNAHDVPLDMIITESEVLYFAKEN